MGEKNVYKVVSIDRCENGFKVEFGKYQSGIKSKEFIAADREALLAILAENIDAEPETVPAAPHPVTRSWFGVYLAFLLLAAPLAHAQNLLAPVCPSGRRPAELSISPSWHTTLAAGTSQPKLWQVGYLNAIPAFALRWQPVMQYAVPFVRLARREIVGVDLMVRAKAVQGADVIADLYLFGPDGLGDPQHMSAEQLSALAAQGPLLENATFFEGATADPYVIFADGIVPFLESAVARKEKSISITMAPFWDVPVPSNQMRFASASLRIYHCPLE